jgi:hypothetical protein
MPISDLPLRDVRVIANWQRASLGAVLLVQRREERVIGLRCEYLVQDIKLDALLIATGDDTGKLLLASDVPGPALDVSELYELVLSSPSASLRFSQMVPGMVFEERGAFFVWFNPVTGSGEGFICIANGEQPAAIGSHVRGLGDDRVFVADSVIAKRKVLPPT